jgi:spore coat polysaccharide biosynthesis protein SpsF
MILAVLQARTSSSRLPQKIMKDILGKPMILRQIERLQRSKKMDKLVVATSIESSDDVLEALCKENKIACYRGSLDDVLDRIFQAAKVFQPETVVRLTGDCPLSDPQVIDDVIDYFQTTKADYVSNALEPTFPDGLDCEVFKYSVLEKTWENASKQSEREHVTPYIYNNRDQFAVKVYKNNVNLSELRWTVDEPKDYEFVQKIYQKLYNKNPAFGFGDILECLEENPELLSINSDIVRNAGYLKSLKKEDGKDKS